MAETSADAVFAMLDSAQAMLNKIEACPVEKASDKQDLFPNFEKFMQHWKKTRKTLSPVMDSQKQEVAAVPADPEEQSCLQEPSSRMAETSIDNVFAMLDGAQAMLESAFAVSHHASDLEEQVAVKEDEEKHATEVEDLKNQNAVQQTQHEATSNLPIQQKSFEDVDFDLSLGGFGNEVNELQQEWEAVEYEFLQHVKESEDKHVKKVEDLKNQNAELQTQHETKLEQRMHSGDEDMMKLHQECEAVEASDDKHAKKLLLQFHRHQYSKLQTRYVVMKKRYGRKAGEGVLDEDKAWQLENLNAELQMKYETILKYETIMK